MKHFRFWSFIRHRRCFYAGIIFSGSGLDHDAAQALRPFPSAFYGSRCRGCRLALGVTFPAPKKSRPFPPAVSLRTGVGRMRGIQAGFLYFVENNHTYDWWYFPFQLCSVPMYLGLLLPAANSVPRLRSVFTVFIQDYGLLGGIMALLEPSGLMHPYWLMTIHGFLWHFILIFMGLSCAFQTESGKDIRSFLRTIPLFLFCAALATAVNLLSHPYGDADMFYLSLYYPNSQIVFHQIALTLGVGTGNILYLLSMILGGGICHLISKKLYYFQKHHSKASLF